MSLIRSVLTFSVPAWVVALGIAAAGAALSVSEYRIHTLTESLAQANRAIGQLQSSIKNQNAGIEATVKAAQSALRLSQAAQKAAQARHAGDAATIAALRARRLETDPAKACEAADGIIHQFFFPQPKGAT